MTSPDTADLSPNRRPLQRSDASWTDDLPLCDHSDVGIAPHTTYGGMMPETYVYENRVFNFATDNNLFLYGVFDGHDGSRAAHFASERLPAELLLGQLTPGADDEIIKSILVQAFSVVERGFFESIDVELAQKTHLQSQLPEPADLAEKLYPSVVQQIEALNDAIKGGTTALVALIINDILYVANVGDSRALLCQYDNKDHLKVEQLNDDHDVHNQNEVERLASLGLNIENLKSSQGGKFNFTRCIGDYLLKGGYKDNELLKTATSEPIIAKADVYGGISLKDIKNGFLVLMSDAVYKSYQQAAGKRDVNDDIAHIVANQLRHSNRIRGVAQSVVDKIAFYHSETFGKQHGKNRDDMTLIVRNINHPMGSSALPSLITDEILSRQHPVSIPYEDSSIRFAAVGSDDIFTTTSNTSTNNKPLSLVMPSQQQSSASRDHSAAVLTTSYLPSHHTSSSSAAAIHSSTSTSPSDDTPTNLTNKSQLSMEQLAPVVPPNIQTFDDMYFRIDRQGTLELDDDNRVAPYVNFSCFDKEAWMVAERNNLLESGGAVTTNGA